ncbi:aminoglycoside phosphotransferase family protein [Candidatus Odyssella thessalonicensis]|uniref:aminoglycoside phosphotransferase family protein n=1 Tax=Candidatus Odyssella thessalonicensis TaxID=84647 RepID=UPI000225ABE1|nr:phosphotransferase [Candidatus Odyssella thessalonicensis]
MTFVTCERESSLRALLAEHGFSHATISFLAGDASPRKYFRLQQDKGTAVLMDTPVSQRPEQFVRIANLLREQGFSTPQIIGQNIKDGYLLLEDLKDATFTKVIKADTQQMPRLYELATTTLITLIQAFPFKPDDLEDYSEQQFLEGILLFTHWCFPACHGYSLKAAAQQEFKDLWSQIFKELDSLPKTVMLRDFHVDNLIHLEERSGIQACGLLDFQDAQWGPMVYDFMSLIDDVRITLPSPIEDACWTSYSQAFPMFKKGTRERALAHMMSTSRLLRILGVFTRLARQDGKRHYLNYMPRVWELLDKNLRLPELSQLHNWFTKYVSKREVLL